MRRERGQTSIEYLGLIVVLVAVVGVLAGAGFGDGIAARIGCAIQLTDCGGGATTARAPAPPAAVDPALTPTERAALAGPPAGAQEVLAGLTPEERRWLAENDPEAAAGAAAAQTWAERRDALRRLRDVPLEDFLAEKRSPDRDERNDWTDDGCSAPIVGSTGRSFDFTSACERHDYGYRNSKDLGLFGEDKRAIDDRFLQDMKDHCATRSVLLQGSCYRWAYTFYAGVRAFG